ncbi:amidohydrolase family protein [Luteimonas fraxinea]|uniref:Amidohydrolase family protein n=1 Tax=Luteimonas fraxinea TaxID=2901869 RepID=A0ABS8UA70_9GAMM|nr:amidohydrolase family protein [Luteimonas fraxinea]MCD9096390.1 amidohydrolase family protein [Luteimonas fraxinea]UHH10236.1 amidohydrolase family protein [Luteimonas fraxinea]
MRWWHGLAATSLLLAGAAQAQTTTDAGNAGTFAFVGVDLLPMDRDVRLSSQTVVVRDGRITAIGPRDDIEVPGDATRIDGSGRVLMPGLAEFHGHVPGGDDPVYVQDTLDLYLANGVTLVRNMSGDVSHPELRTRIERGEVNGPTMVVASPWLRSQDADEAVREVRAHHAAGFDLVKIGSIPADAYPRMAETAHAVGIPFAGHIPEGVPLEVALDAKQASIDHFDRYVEFLVPPGTETGEREAGWFGSGWVQWADRGRIDEAVSRTRAAGTWNVPTLTLVEHMASSETPEAMLQWPEMRYMPASERERWRRAKHEYAARDTFQPDAAQALVILRRELLKALHDGDAPIVLGSDAPQFFNVPGFSIHREMAMMQAAGLTPYEVLVTGTRNAALALGTPDAFGTVEVGRRADLVLLAGDPREDLSHAQAPLGVMARGRWSPREALDARLAEIAERHAD